MNKTAHVIIWGFGRRTSPRNLFHLVDGDPQAWRGGPPMDIFHDAPLANLFARYLLRDGAFDAVLNTGADGDALKAAFYRRLSGHDVTIVRFRNCAITDEEVAAVRAEGVRVQVVDLETAQSDRPDPWFRRPADYWRSAPYPGERPDCSWRLVGDQVHRLVPTTGGWSDASTGEDVVLEGRVFILAYGSNANPNKLRRIDAVMLQSQITDAQAVWCDARRSTDDSVVATLVEVPGHVEACPVLAVRAEDLSRVDGWEKPAYRRMNFWGRCTLENGSDIVPEVYVGGPRRKPLRKRGNYVPLHGTDYGFVDRLV